MEREEIEMEKRIFDGVYPIKYCEIRNVLENQI
jgi:hypothetical protein